MPSLQIPDMPDELYESLKRRAEKDHRSLAQQAVVLISEALKSRGPDSTLRMEAIKKIQSKKVLVKSKEIDIVDLIREDRQR